MITKSQTQWFGYTNTYLSCMLCRPSVQDFFALILNNPQKYLLCGGSIRFLQKHWCPEQPACRQAGNRRPTLTSFVSGRPFTLEMFLLVTFQNRALFDSCKNLVPRAGIGALRSLRSLRVGHSPLKCSCSSHFKNRALFDSCKHWCPEQESNLQPPDSKSVTLSN